MSQRISIECKTNVAHISCIADVLIATPLLKRALLAEIAHDLREGSSFECDRDTFFAGLAESIITLGIATIDSPDPDDYSKVPGGYERLLSDTLVEWTRLFGHSSETHHSIKIELDLDASDIARAYGYAYAMGITDPEDDPASCDADTLISWATQMFLDIGERSIDEFALTSRDYRLAESAVRRLLPFLFRLFEFGCQVHVSSLDESSKST